MAELNTKMPFGFCFSDGRVETKKRTPWISADELEPGRVWKVEVYRRRGHLVNQPKNSAAGQ